MSRLDPGPGIKCDTDIGCRSELADPESATTKIAIPCVLPESGQNRGSSLRDANNRSTLLIAGDSRSQSAEAGSRFLRRLQLGVWFAKISAMKTKEAVQLALDAADQICLKYLADLNDSDLLVRPHPNCNHINWQLGHLILSEHEMLSESLPLPMAPLPDRLARRYSKEQAQSDDLESLYGLESLLEFYREVRGATLRGLISMDELMLNEPAVLRIRSYAPTVGSAFLMVAAHWQMHSGQWAVVRRMLSKPIVI